MVAGDGPKGVNARQRVAVVPGNPSEDKRLVRILIVGINYSPEETGIAPYTAGLAEHLAAKGYSVVAVTGLPSYPQWRAYDGYRRLLWKHESVSAGAGVSRPASA